MAAALGIYGAMIAVSAWRWRVLIETQQVDCSIGHLVSSFLVATFFNNFLPSNIGGDVVRIADTAPLMASRTRATAVVFIDRGLGLVALMLVAALGSAAAARNGIDIPRQRVSVDRAGRDGARGDAAAVRAAPRVHGAGAAEAAG